MNKDNTTAAIKAKAIELGFSGINIAKAEFMTEEAKHLEQWLNAGYQGDMQYMENHFDMRVNPSLLVPGAKSVVCLLFNYYTDKVQEDVAAPKLSMYAYGKDYHKVVKKKLKELYAYIKLIAGDVQGRYFVDSAPVMERDWAKRAGLGWTGKNTLLINPKKGSYFFLAEIICDLELVYDSPMKDYCGTCTRCIEACPTDAIAKDGYILDSSKCISYLTIELKDEIPKAFEGHMDNWMYGCDICQQVCPWNRFSTTHNEPSFLPSDALMTLTKKEWEEVTEPTFNLLFEGSAVKRTKFAGLKRNLNFLNRKNGSIIAK